MGAFKYLETFFKRPMKLRVGGTKRASLQSFKTRGQGIIRVVVVVLVVDVVIVVVLFAATFF